MQRVTSTGTWGTGRRSCSGSMTSIPSGLFTTGRQALQIRTLLMGRSRGKYGNVLGFFKYSPADHYKKTPAVGFARFRLDFQSGRISEYFADSDKWVNMWNTVDSSNNYITSDDVRARGTKCIAGYCYLNKPIWVMVR